MRLTSENRWPDAADLLFLQSGAAHRLCEANMHKISFVVPTKDRPEDLAKLLASIAAQTRKPDQIIQPWMFGHGETKATCLWLKNLPCLTPTEMVEGREQRIWKLPPSKDRWKIRSKTFQGIADAMAQQWGSL